MSFWQFMAAVNGYVAANAPDDKSLDDAEIDEIWNWMNDGDRR